MALTVMELENAKPKAKKYKMLDGGGLRSARLADRNQVLALALSIQCWRKEHDIRGVPGCWPEGSSRTSLRHEKDIGDRCQPDS